MSQINTLSLFYYGQTITYQNQFLDFDEGGSVFTAILVPDAYTLTTFAQHVADQMTAYGGQTYSVAVDRTTRKLTISAAGTFNLRCATGPNIGTAPWSLMGFSATDRTGTDSYQGQSGSGSVYQTQYPMDKYISLDDKQVLETPTVNTSASGVVWAVNFGIGRRMEAQIRVITNKTGLNNTPFFSNASGYANAQAFMQYLMTKAPVEFIPDVSDPTTFDSILLDGDDIDKTGMGYGLVGMGAPGFFQTGKLLFREYHT